MFNREAKSRRGDDVNLSFVYCPFWRGGKRGTSMLPAKFRSLFPLILVAVPCFALDQLTKWLVEQNIRRGGWYILIDGVFNLRHDRNSGAAFGIMPGQNVLLIIITIVAIGFIFFYYRQFQTNLWMRIALGFLLGGALGKFRRSSSSRRGCGFSTDRDSKSGALVADV